MRLTVLVLEHPSPGHSQRARQLPALHFVIEPEPDKMALGVSVVHEGLSPMKDRHVVQKPQVTLLHRRLDLVLLRYEMYSIKRLGLGLCKAWNTGRAGAVGRVSD